MDNQLLTEMFDEGKSDEIWVNDFTQESAQKFRKAVMAAHKEDPSKPIVIYIDSYGGQVDALAKMIETLDEVPNPILTVCMGKAMSCGAILLSHGDVRYCGIHSRVMIHEVSGGAMGDVHDVNADAIEIKRLNRYFLGLLAKNCQIKGGYDGLRQMIKDRDGRDNYLDANASKEFGLVDIVGLPALKTSMVHEVGIIFPYKEKSETKTKHVKKKKKSDSKR